MGRINLWIIIKYRMLAVTFRIDISINVKTFFYIGIIQLLSLMAYLVTVS